MPQPCHELLQTCQDHISCFGFTAFNHFESSSIILEQDKITSSAFIGLLH
jgi:hypothetical protein